MARFAFLPRFRTVALLLLAALLFMRLGPLCEGSAMAAAPASSAMADCVDRSADTPVKKAPLSACALPCQALAPDRIGAVEGVAYAATLPWPPRDSELRGLSRSPATPPPRFA